MTFRLTCFLAVANTKILQIANTLLEHNVFSKCFFLVHCPLNSFFYHYKYMFMTYTLCAICILVINLAYQKNFNLVAIIDKTINRRELIFNDFFLKKVNSLEKSRGNSSCEFFIYHVTRMF